MSDKKKVLILYTGGTLGMIKTANGYQTKSGFLADYLVKMPELKHESMPYYDLIEYQNLIDSANMSVSDWNTIGQDICNYYQKYDAFLILHGTDTLAYTASALSFMLENLAKPVILTGSQIPIMEINSDARNNIIHALLIATQYALNEVCIFFNNHLLRGNRAYKYNAYGFDAFISPNYPALITVGIEIHCRSTLCLPKPTQPFRFQLMKEKKIATFCFFPGVDLSLLQQIVYQSIDALILLTYGVGNVPAKENRLLSALEKAQQKSILVVNTSQCLKGTVNMNAYATGHILKDYGVVGCNNMTKETILAKLQYLLSQKPFDLAENKKLFSSPLRGEMCLFASADANF